MENLSGFSYLLPKSGSRSQMKRLFFARVSGGRRLASACGEQDSATHVDQLSGNKCRATNWYNDYQFPSMARLQVSWRRLACYARRPIAGKQKLTPELILLLLHIC